MRENPSNPGVIAHPGNLQYNASRGLYWSIIRFENPDHSSLSSVFFCGSEEYFWKHFGTREYTQEQLSKWHKDVVTKWVMAPFNIFDEVAYFEVYATTPDGYTAGQQFLTELYERHA